MATAERVHGAADTNSQDHPWLVGGGTMGELIGARDWSPTSLGTIGSWPQSLRTAVGMTLANKFPCILAWGPELSCIYNDAYRPFLSGKPEALGRPLFDVWAEFTDVIAPLVTTARAGVTSYFENAPFKLMRHGVLEDRFFDYCVLPVYDETGTVAGVFITATETTENIRNQSAVRKSEKRFQALLQATSDVIYRMSPDWSELRQVSGGGFVSDTEAPIPNWEWMDRYIEPDDQPRCRAAIQEAVLNKHIFELEHRVRQVDGTLGWTLSRAVPILGADGDVIEWFGAASDITPRKTAEEAMAEAKKSADQANLAKSKFLAAASHDLRQPIQSMILFAHALAAKLKDHPALAMVEKMMSAQDAFKALLDSLLDLSKLDAGLVIPDRQPVACTDVINDLAGAYELRASEKGLKFKAIRSDAWLLTDRTLLSRILSNLLDNALKYTLQGGILLHCRRAGPKLRIDVVDTGVGIAAEHREEIFCEFVQVGEVGRDQKQGMGLGLATVKRLCELLDYDLQVWSRPGKGSRFSVCVPLSGSDECSASESMSDVLDRGKRILMVDDEWTILEGLRALAEGWGYDAMTAGTLPEAMDRLDQIGQPDAIVADFRLGGGITGAQLIEAVRERAGTKIPAIVITGDTSVRDEGEFVILHKPFSPDVLRRTLSEACHPG